MNNKNLNKINPIKASFEHLEEAHMGYKGHLLHAFHQSNRLIVVAIKSYIHGLFPMWYKADGPRTIIRMYHEIRKIHHIDKMAQKMERDKESKEITSCEEPLKIKAVKKI